MCDRCVKQDVEDEIQSETSGSEQRPELLETGDGSKYGMTV
jgi:hypothetical protein